MATKTQKSAVRFIDRDGYEWITGEFTSKQIETWLKRYKANGIFLSVRVLPSQMKAVA